MLDLILKLADTPGKNDKIRILKENDSPRLRTMLDYALNPYKKYFMRKIPENQSEVTLPAFLSDPFPDMIALLDKLRNREVTGHAAQNEVLRVISMFSFEDKEMFMRILTKDLIAGVNTGIVNAAFPDLIPEFDVQLAATWDEKKLTFPRIAEHKMDGMRCMAFIEGTEPEDVVFMSRGGKPIETLDTVAEELVKIFPVGTVLDGEAMTLASDFEDRMSGVKRKKAKLDQTYIYYIYDCLSAEEFRDQLCVAGFEERRARFVPAIEEAKPKLLKVLYGTPVANMDEVDVAFAEARRQGKEGLILKEPNGSYDFKRSRTWMKKKPFETTDVEIIGYEEGTGKNVGKLGAALYELDGIICKVGTGFSDKEREDYFGPQVVGRIFEVEFMEKTKKGRSRHASFIRDRTLKGEKS